MRILSAPEKVTLNITNRCNLNCLYCAVSSTKNDPGDLSLEEWTGVIRELARIKVFRLLLSGGEPFTRPDLPDILKTILDLPFRFSINTNGTLLDERVLSLLSGSPRLENIQVSLDGPDPATHDALQGKGAFSRTLAGVKSLQQHRLPFTFFVVVCRRNKGHLREIVELAEGLGAVRVTFSDLVPQGGALDHLGDLFLSFEEQKGVEGELRELKGEFPQLVGGSLVQAIEWMDEVSRMDLNESENRAAGLIRSCGGSLRECSIRPEGWVIPCDRLWHYTVGNVREASFQSIWLHSQGFQNFRKRYSRTIDSFPECTDCRYTPVCTGGCPAVPYNMGRGIEGWDPLSCYRVFTGEKQSYI